MTAEELLAAMAEQEPLVEDHAYCTIDPETRVITIPPEYQLLGVESDEKAERIYFKCPKIVGDNIDLSKLALRVNFRNAGQAVDQYLVDDVAVDGDNITFSWLLSRRVTQYEGDVNFIVCAVRVSGETITNEWNTTLATAQVLEGLEAEMVLPEEETDIVNQLLSLAETRLNDVKEATADANTAASNANQKAQEAENAAEDARGVIEQITKDSYLHTALQSFIDTVTATPTSYGNAVVKKIEGYIRQNQSKGYQLFDASKLASKTQDGVAVTNNGDGSFTVSGNGNLSEICSTSYDDANIAQKLKAGKIRLKTESNPYPYFYVQFRTSAGENVAVVSTNSKEKDITSDDLTKITSVRFGFYGDPSQTIVPGTIKPMLYQDGDGTWEPYTGGQPAPNPDYPQVIHGVGDMGFFDGEQQYVYHDNDNTLNNNPEWVSSINKVPCKTGDNIEIIYTVANSKSMYGIIYYKGDKFISALATQTGNGKFIVPSGVDGFQWQVYDGSAQPDPSKVVVTINGMYAICVKMKGVNLCEGVESGAWLNASGNPIATDDYVRTKKIKVNENTTYKESSDIDLDGISKTVVFWDKDGKYIKYQAVGASIQTPANCGYMAINYCKSGLVLGNVRDVMIAESAIFPEEFIPYQGDVTYIPVDYPLFDGDKIIQRNGEYKLVRRRGFRIYDGSDDEDWKINYVAGSVEQNSVFNVYIGDMANDAKKEQYVPCNYFGNKAMGYNTNSTYVSLSGNYNIILSPDMKIDTVQKWKDWLKAHALFSVYELETPTEEDLSPEAQKALYSIMATDEQTELTIVGVPADAEIQNQFLLPRNEDGALNTTAYCTGVKNKLTLDELLAQNLDSRVNKLEIDNAALAEQTIIVE